MTEFERRWGRLEAWLTGVLAALALLLICFEVATRYFLPRYLPDWGAEFVIYFTVWAIFIAGSSLVAESRHVRADIVIRLLPAGAQRLLEVLNALAGLLFCALIAYYGYEVVEFAHRLDERSESSMLFPLYLYYLCLPVGMALMTVRFLIRLKRYVFNFDAATMTVGDADRLRDH